MGAQQDMRSAKFKQQPRVKDHIACNDREGTSPECLRIPIACPNMSFRRPLVGVGSVQDVLFVDLLLLLPSILSVLVWLFHHDPLLFGNLWQLRSDLNAFGWR